MGEWLTRLVDDLTSEGTLIVPGDGGLRIERYDDSTENLPVVLRLGNERTFVEHLDRLGEGAEEVFPDVPPREAGYRLFLVHLGEELAVHATPGAVLSFDREGLLSCDPERPLEGYPVPRTPKGRRGRR